MCILTYVWQISLELYKQKSIYYWHLVDVCKKNTIEHLFNTLVCSQTVTNEHYIPPSIMCSGVVQIDNTIGI